MLVSAIGYLNRAPRRESGCNNISTKNSDNQGFGTFSQQISKTSSINIIDYVKTLFNSDKQSSNLDICL